MFFAPAGGLVVTLQDAAIFTVVPHVYKLLVAGRASGRPQSCSTSAPTAAPCVAGMVLPAAAFWLNAHRPPLFRNVFLQALDVVPISHSRPITRLPAAVGGVAR